MSASSSSARASSCCTETFYRNAYQSTQSNELNDLLSYSPSIYCLEPKRNMEVLMTRTRSRQSSYCVKAKFPSNIIRGSWEDMLVTQPPVNGLTIDLYSSFDCNRDEKNKVQGDGRVRGLYEACEESYRTSGCWMSCTLHQSADWMHLTSDVNNVTGAEMLEILSMQYEELAERDCVWRFKGKG